MRTLSFARVLVLALCALFAASCTSADRAPQAARAPALANGVEPANADGVEPARAAAPPAEFLAALPVAAEPPARPATDWLVDARPYAARVSRSADGRRIVLDNGLVRREWVIAPDVACVSFRNLVTGAELVRAVRPEVRIALDEGGESAAPADERARPFAAEASPAARLEPVGGLAGQPNHAFLTPAMLAAMTRDAAARWRCTELATGPIRPRLAWKRVRHDEGRPWPPPGVELVFRFERDGARGAAPVLEVRYELHDGLPLVSKSFALENRGAPRVLHAFESELLAVVEAESIVDPVTDWRRPDLHVECDFAFHGMDSKSSSRAVRWVADPLYATQVNYERKTPALLVCSPPIGPELRLAAGERFESFRAFELALDTSDRERAGLAQRRMYRVIAPWCTENPLLLHLRSADDASVERAIDQCAEVGFEMIVLSFGSGFDVEDRSPANVARATRWVELARARGVELGTYALLSSRSIDAANDVVDRATGKPGGAIFGNAPCLQSAWGRRNFAELLATYDATGLAVLEHDGSYPGDPCASTEHPGHAGFLDSQWTQWTAIRDLYAAFRARGVYLNVPDYYFLAGSSKTGMGYRETNWSLPRDEQILHARQNVFDGTWTRTPTMGWMFVPLTEYQGGGAAATIEPLSEHLDAYEAHLANDLGLGVQACWRGPRLYDTDATKALVKTWVGFYRAHRAILESDLLHGRRADGRDVDWMLHVNPELDECALAMAYNPLPQAVERELVLPLHYAGCAAGDEVLVRVHDGPETWMQVDAREELPVRVRIDARSATWVVVRRARALPGRGSRS